MEKNLWGLNFRDVSIADPPESIVEEYCKNLREITDGRVIARVASYSGPTSDYNRINPGITDVLSAVLSKDKIEHINIQEDLGDVGSAPNMYFAYEFFITSPSTPNYKYRIMFFTYTAGRYPLDIVLDDDIASDVKKGQKISCVSEDKFKEILELVISSETVKKVIDTLYAIALNEERKKGVATDIAI